MTVSVTIGGAAVDPEAIELNGGLQALSSMATGGYVEAVAVIDDPEGIYDFVKWQQVVVEESDCPTFFKRSFTGYLKAATTNRSGYKSGASRVHTLTITDINALLHMQPLYGASAIRPRESGSARLAYLMTTPGMAGIVFDNGLITPNAAMFGEDDLRQQYHDEVLQSICVAGIGARIFYLTYMESADAGEEITLFYAEPQAVLRVSTLQVSNILSSIDQTQTFMPYMDAELEADGEDIYCGVWAIYGGAGNKLFTHNQTTHDTYFGSSSPAGLHRIAVLDLPRVGELATAQHHSDVYLNVHSGSTDTLSYTLRLPSDKVNLVQAGMLLPSELSHLMGYETGGVSPRINERTISLTPDTNKFYDCVLKLSLNGAPIVGGGGGEPFPFEPRAHWYEGTFTFLEDSEGSADGFSGSTVYSNNTNGADFLPDTTYNYHIQLDAVNPGAYAPVLWINVGGASTIGALWATSALPPFGSFTVDDSFVTGHSGLPTNPLHLHASQAGSHGSMYCCTVVRFWIDPDGWAISEPPGTGQWVTDEVVTMVGATGTTAYPYAAGSPKVKVDGVPIINGLTELDPAAGTFQLDFVPIPANGDTPGEVVTITYQAGAGPTLAITSLTSADTASDLLTAIADLSVTTIELASGDYDWQNVVITTDRTSAPLTIRPAIGATVNFVGPATTTGVIFQIGSSAVNKAKWITFDGLDRNGGGAMIFKDFLLAQSGVFQPQSSDHCSFVNLTFTNLGRDTGIPGQGPQKSWCFYISGGGGGNNDHLLIDSCHLLPPATNREISAIQIDSSGSHGQIQITNIDMAEYHFAFYCARPVTNLLLTDWTIDDCGRTAGPFSIHITGAVSIAGLYSGLVATASDPYVDDHSGGGVVVDGGGNSGL